jgi:hypothetical protein
LFLESSEYCKHFNFSPKSDPFLVQPSLKQHVTTTAAPAVGGGAQGLKNLRKQTNPNVVRKEKMVVALPNNLLKLIRQSEVYLMEEAVTD